MKRFQRLESGETQRAQSPLEEFAQVPFAALAEYFRSHPPSVERRTALELEIDARGFDASKPTRPLAMHDLLHPAKAVTGPNDAQIVSPVVSPIL